jgi:hypothetical protein
VLAKPSGQPPKATPSAANPSQPGLKEWTAQSTGGPAGPAGGNPNAGPADQGYGNQGDVDTGSGGQGYYDAGYDPAAYDQGGYYAGSAPTQEQPAYTDMSCPSCGTINPGTRRFCSHCGYAFFYGEADAYAAYGDGGQRTRVHGWFERGLPARQIRPVDAGGKTTLAHEADSRRPKQRSGPVDGTSAPGGIKISDPGDRYEREAAANADQVMSGPVPVQTAALSAPSPSVQRHAAEEEPPVHGMFVQRQDEEEEPVQGLFVQRAEGEEEEEPGQGLFVQREGEEEKEEETSA